MHFICLFHLAPRGYDLCVFVSPAHLAYSLAHDRPSKNVYWILKNLFILKYIFNRHVTYFQQLQKEEIELHCL